jgi:hypothetical protein
MRFDNDLEDGPSLEIEITSPTDGDTLIGPATGQPITVAGTVGGNLVSLDDVTVINC